MQVKHQVSRADLLRWFKASSSEEEQVLVGELLGYELPWVNQKVFFDPSSFINESQQVLFEPQPTFQPHSSQSELEQRPLAIFYALTEREVYQNEDEAKLPKLLQGVEPLATADLQPWEFTKPLTHQSILPESRLVPFVQNSLHLEQGQYLDLTVLVKKLARLQILPRIPKAPRQVVSGRLYILLDASQRMRPFWDDLSEVAALIKRKYGRVGLEVRIIEACPPTRYSDWLSENSIPQAWQNFARPSTVLVLSDLGQLTVHDSLVRQQWLCFIQSLQQPTCRVYALSPISPEQQDLRFRKLLTQVLWNRNSLLKSQANQGNQKSQYAKVERVLGLISAAVHVEQELLRAILRCLPSDQADSGVEAAVYKHADINFGLTAISLKAGKREAYQALFKVEPVDLQQQVIALIRQQHISQFPAVWAEEVLMLSDLISFELSELEQAQTFMSRFTSQFSTRSEDLGMKQFAQRHLQRLGAKGEHSAALYGLAYREQLLAGKEIPAGFDASVVQAIIQQATENTEYFLRQKGESIWLKHKGWADYFQLPQVSSPLGKITVQQDILTLKQGNRTRIVPVQTEQTLFELGDEPNFELDTGRERLQFDAIPKPAWATRIWRNAKGLFAAIPWQGEEIEVAWQAATEKVNKGYWDWQEPFGEDEFGVYVNLEMDTQTSSYKKTEDIFISYSHSNIEWVNKLVKNLELTGFSICKDSNKNFIGNDLSQHMKQMLISKVTIFVVSNALAKTNILNNELKYFLEKNIKNVCLVFCEPLENSRLFNQFECLDMKEWKGSIYDNSYQNLIKNLEGYLSKINHESKNYITQRFRFIPAGSFMMGSSEDELERSNNETQHQVTLTKSFWLADTTVTQALWQTVMGTKNSSRINLSAQYPVEKASWHNVQSFIRALQTATPNLSVRLPTEAEWEYACRAGTITPFFFGKTITPEQASYSESYLSNKKVKVSYKGKVVPVKTLPPNAWGLYEMHGNVWEWCEDIYQKDLGKAAVVDPLVTMSNQVHTLNNLSFHVMRGGSCVKSAKFLRSAYRKNYPPDYEDYVGFRLVIDYFDSLNASKAVGLKGFKIEVWTGAQVKFNHKNGTLSVKKGDMLAHALKPKGEMILSTLSITIKQKVIANQFVKVNAYVQNKEVVEIEAIE